MRIDAHVHFYDPAFGIFAWPPPGDKYHRVIDSGMFERDHAGAVDAAIVVGCSNEYALNERIMDAYADDPRVAGYIAQLSPDEEMAAGVRALSKHPKYRGFRFFSAEGLADREQEHGQKQRQERVQGRGLLQIERALDAAAEGVVELLGNWRHSWKYAGLIRKYPEKCFIIEHFGGLEFDGAPLPGGYCDFLAELASLPNAAIKLSGIFTLCKLAPKATAPEFYGDAFEAAFAAFGEDRCVFGSDWPVMDAPYEAAIAVTEHFCGRHSGTALGKAMGGNAERLYSL